MTIEEVLLFVGKLKAQVSEWKRQQDEFAAARHAEGILYARMVGLEDVLHRIFRETEQEIALERAAEAERAVNAPIYR